MKFDTIYKFVAASLAIAYFIGLLVGLVVFNFNIRNYQETDITRSFYFSGQISFSEVFSETLESSFKIAILPFSFIIIGTKTGFTHATYILSPFLGQIKLATLLIPAIFYFITYIILSAIGIKLFATIIIFFVNKILKKEKKQIIKTKLLQKDDIFLLYVAIVSIIIGAIIQVYLSRIFFIFLINLQLITYILIIIIYLGIIIVSFTILYNIIKSVIGNNKQKLW
ncbi:MAG TPA: hypothetical protein PLK55_03805 [archaeon]|nr:hypothetical protein [archaeon]